MIEQRYLIAQDAASFLGLSKWTVYRLVKDQAIPFVQMRGAIRFDKEDLIEWANKNKVPARKALDS